MRKAIISTLKRLIRTKAVILMYHRIAVPQTDIWEIAVSPDNFERHLQILKKNYNVVPLSELVNMIYKRKIKRNTVAITFDDGYIDNFLMARPLLEKYNLPATFFIASGYLGKGKEFWWDALENMILFTEKLPPALTMEISGQTYSFRLDGETVLNEKIRQTHKAWKANEEPPPTLRAQLYYKVWEQIKPLPFYKQQEKLNEIITWAGSTYIDRADSIGMTVQQLQQIATSDLFAVGAHTVNHAALAFHSTSFQKQELEQNRSELKATTGQEIEFVAFPYGNFSEDTIKVVQELNFKAGFTTAEKPVYNYSCPMRLARYQVNNWESKRFENKLKHWFT